MINCDWCPSTLSVKGVTTPQGFRACLCSDCRAINAREIRESLSQT